MASYFVELDSWIIQDGNYGNFRVGLKCSFALEYRVIGDLYGSMQFDEQSCEYKEDNIYQVSGNTSYLSDNVSVIDVGIRAYQEAKPNTNLRLGGGFRGRIGLGIDPFFYVEYLRKQEGLPELIYDWEIEEIFIQKAPLIEVQPKLLERDRTRWGWRSIRKSDAWRDDGGRAIYLLKCKLYSNPPRYSLKNQTHQGNCRQRA